MSKLKHNTLSTIKLMEEILKENKEGLSIYNILEEVSKELNVDPEDSEKMNDIYMELTLSGKFVYLGKDIWALKDDNLEYWDKDGYSYGEHPELVASFEEDEDIDFSDFNLDDIDFDEEVTKDLDDEDEEEIDDIDPEEKQYVDVGLDLTSTDEDEGDIDLDLDQDDDFEDEDDYNEIMDDYEDMYD